jgi:hypothetical protein
MQKTERQVVEGPEQDRLGMRHPDIKVATDFRGMVSL